MDVSYSRSTSIIVLAHVCYFSPALDLNRSRARVAGWQALETRLEARLEARVDAKAENGKASEAQNAAVAALQEAMENQQNQVRRRCRYFLSGNARVLGSLQ